MSKGKKESGSKMGRPPVPDTERRSARITLRLKPRELRRLEREAKKAGLKVGPYLLSFWPGRDKGED